MIYLDNAATYITNNDDVIKVFNQTLKDFPTNPNSLYRLSYLANREIDKCRDEIISLLKLNNNYEVIFNSCASEGINTALKGYAIKNRNRGNRILIFSNEHSSVINSAKFLQRNGFEVIYIKSKPNGEIDYEDLKNNINDKTILVSVMSVNNEVGSINDINKIYDVVKQYPKCVFFSDITQSIGKIDINYVNLDMFAFSAHKIGGLIGSGVLIKKKKILLEKLIDGGPQENNYRAGTQSLALIKSTTYALKKSISDLNKNFNYVNSLKLFLLDELNKINEIVINSNSSFPYIINFSLKNKKASVVIEALSNVDICVSSVSSCDSKFNKSSYVLLNMGLNNNLSTNSIRVSLSNINTKDEINIFIKELNRIIKEIK